MMWDTQNDAMPASRGRLDATVRGAALAILAVLASGSAFAQAGGAFWVGGNFVRPTPQPGGYALVDTGERYGSWRVVGAPGNVSWISGTYAHGGFTFPAQSGKPGDSWANLAGVSATPTGISHSPVITTAGASYTLTFYVGNIVNQGGRYGTSSKVLVYENSTLIGIATNGNGAGATAENWAGFSVTFVADASSTVISMVNGDPPNDMNCGVDNIVLAPAAPGARLQGMHSWQ